MEEEKEPGQCGWGVIKPSWCQKLRNPKLVLFVLCWASFVQGMVVNGFSTASISSIEKQLDLNSKEGGLINSCYDIGSALCLIPMTYFGGRGSKPRYIAIGLLVMGIGSFIFILPHYLSGLHVVDSSVDDWCSLSPQNVSSCEKHTSSDYKYFHYVGQLLHGAGASPLFTLGSTFLDENVPKRSSSFYLGIYYTMVFIGAAFGHLSSKAFLAIPVDIDKDDYNSNLTNDNPRFIGAWWLGFLISGVISITVALPVGGFPKILPGSWIYKAEKEGEIYGGKSNVQQNDNTKKPRVSIKSAAVSLLHLLKNPTFMFLNMSGACDFFLIGAASSFGPKYLEFQFQIPASDAALYTGIVIVLAGSLGTFLGGFVVKRFDLPIRTILKLNFVVMALSVLLTTSYLVTCEEERFAGVNTPYMNDPSSVSIETDTLGNLTANCNSQCHCSEEYYNPVCGNGVLYFSSCHAGCTTVRQDGDRVTYENCTCVHGTNFSTSPLQVVTTGKCEWTCKGKLIIFLPLFTVTVLLTFLAAIPGLTATLRCLPLTERPFGLGIQWILARCLGSIIGPIVMGNIFDMSCLMLEKKCDEYGACSIYDNLTLSRNIFAMTIVIRCMSSSFTFLAHFFYKHHDEKAEVKDKTSTVFENGGLCIDEEEPPKGIAFQTENTRL